MRAKQEGYRSRAAYKLLEIQKKFEIIRPDDNIVDLGAAPASWLQVERALTEGRVVGVDLNPIAHLDGVETIKEISMILKPLSRSGPYSPLSVSCSAMQLPSCRGTGVTTRPG